MKKMLMFLGLKISEILLIVFVPYWLGHILPWAKWFKVGYWLNGLSAVIVPILVAILLFIFFYFIILHPVLYWLAFNWNMVYKEKNNPFADLLEKLY